MKNLRKGIASSLVILLIIGIFTGILPINKSFAEQAQLDLEVKSAILIEASTGKVLYEFNADQPLPPASMTKMMTEYLILDAISKGNLSWDDVVTTSEYGHFLGKHGGSRVFLGNGEKRTVRELFSAMAIYSANDATAMLAEKLAGSETNFVNMMNEKAKEFGMKNTHFVTSSGFPENMLVDPATGKNYRPQVEGDHYMSAEDTAILGRHLILDHPEVTQFTSKAKEVFRAEQAKPFEMTNWNWLVPGLKYGYEGLDGLKTGSTEAAGYCVTATATRNGMRLISVVMGAATEDKRFEETIKLLDYGFNNYELVQLSASGSKIEGAEEAKVSKGKDKKVGIVTGDSYKTVIKKGEQALYEPKVTTNPEQLKAPLKKGEAVGTLVYEYKGSEKYRYLTPEDEERSIIPMVTDQEVEKAGWLRLFFRAILTFIGDIFSQISKTVVGWFS